MIDGCATRSDVNTKGAGKTQTVAVLGTCFTSEAASIAASTTIVAAAGMPSGYVTHWTLLSTASTTRTKQAFDGIARGGRRESPYTVSQVPILSPVR